MKRDLTEFTQVVQHDTACTIAATASVVKEKLAVSKGLVTEMKGRIARKNTGRVSYVLVHVYQIDSLLL